MSTCPVLELSTVYCWAKFVNAACCNKVKSIAKNPEKAGDRRDISQSPAPVAIRAGARQGVNALFAIAACDGPAAVVAA